jgi:[ribosomal protein S5]-alanine N-acetyltransferase
MKEQPTIITERLILRAYAITDAKDLRRLIGDYAVVDTLLTVPHPYLDGMAEDWISKRQNIYDERKAVNFAITYREQGYLIGGISLENINLTYESAEIGYWLGKSYWHKGYCTEAARTVLKYGFEVLGLNRIFAMHMTRNPRSGNVMQKIGMKHEGHMRQQWKRWGKFEDVEMYATLRSDFLDSP